MPEDEEVFEMYLFLNMHDLEKNRKPEGFKRKDNMKLVFPLSRKEFYIRNEDEEEASEVVRLTEKMSRILKKASIEHDVEWNQLYLSEEEEE